MICSKSRLPIAYRLYLPEVWANDKERTQEAGIPESVKFQTKSQTGLGQIRQAVTDITIDPKLDTRLREKAEAEGLTVSAYVERLVYADQAAEEERETLALERLNSGPAIEVGASYWEEKHRQLDERLKRTGTR